jgi:hypothetical protein
MKNAVFRDVTPCGSCKNRHYSRILDYASVSERRILPGEEPLDLDSRWQMAFWYGEEIASVVRAVTVYNKYKSCRGQTVQRLSCSQWLHWQGLNNLYTSQRLCSDMGNDSYGTGQWTYRPQYVLNSCVDWFVGWLYNWSMFCIARLKQKQTPWPLVRKRTIPTERPFLASHFLIIWNEGRLCGLMIRVNGYRCRGSGFDSWPYPIFWEVVGLERGPFSPVRITEELHEWKNGGFGLENRG